MQLSKRRIAIVVVALGLIGALFVVGSALWPPFGPPPRDITDVIPPGENSTGMPLKLPSGFSISIFAKDLPGARVMRFDSFGNLWLSRTSEGAVALLEVDRETGTVRSQSDIFRDLRKPHGLAFDPQQPFLLYIAEEDRVWQVTAYSDDPGEGVLELPYGDGHFTRTIGFGPDEKLYISVGSSCNVCRESDEWRASILRYDPATGASEIFGRGLRNAVFFTWDFSGRMWATEMGRDWLGDDLPPDEINIVERGRDYGWPICYGKNVHDADFDKNVYIRNPCEEPHEAASFIDIPAHSAPLGLAFVPANSDWPEDYWHDLLVAYHGSWNRSQPAGYKVVRHKFDEAGDYQGAEDFITGWLVPSGVEGLTPEGALGRPVDILIQPDGAMYLSDDKAGVIYKITVNSEQ